MRKIDASVLFSSIMVQWWLKIMAIATFLGIMTVWGIDGLNINTLYNLAIIKLNGFEPLPYSHKDSIFTNTSGDLHAPSPNLAKTEMSPQLSSNLSINDVVVLPWISAEFEANYSSNLVKRWLSPGGEPCKDSKTVDINIPSLDGNGNIQLSTGDVHEFVFHTLDEAGLPHCSGGDYFETDISGERWKARPPVKDMGNGSYSFSLQIHQDFAGDYNLTIILLFRQFQGLKFSPKRFAIDKLIRVVPIKFIRYAALLPEIRQCRESDYSKDKDAWSGRWIRLARNDSCSISNDGRYRCQEPSLPCERPWCEGPLGSLESNGWVYSAHCSFKLFNSKDAWNCLNNRWIFWWGDSNHCDTVRNILIFILNVHDIPIVSRLFDQNITNPNDPSQVVRLTNIFNGHRNISKNYEGLNSLYDAEYRQLVKSYFMQEAVPDTIIMNSGLHDGIYWPNLNQFIRAAENAAAFWAEVKEGMMERMVVPPEIIYRTTVATGGYARSLAYNPQKMEAFSGVMLDKLRQYGVLDRMIDGFDMTYPWHYDNRGNDGIHYGRAPLKMKWRDGEIGHQYFVDIMLGHVLMNAVCVR